MINVLNPHHFADNTTGDYAACLQNIVISLLPKYTKLISRSFCICAIAYVNVGHLKVNV